MKRANTILSEEELVQVLHNRDERGFSCLYNQYYSSLFGIINSILKQKELAEDAVQVVFARIWDAAGQYAPEKGRVFTWMVTIARNCVMDVFRSKEYKKLKQTLDLDEDPELRINLIDQNYHARQNIEGIGLWTIAKGLKLKHYHLLELIYHQGHTFAEAAELLNMPLGTVKTRIKFMIESIRYVLKSDLKIDRDVGAGLEYIHLKLENQRRSFKPRPKLAKKQIINHDHIGKVEEGSTQVALPKIPKIPSVGKAFKAKAREAVRLYLANKMTYAEIAHATGISTTSLRNYLFQVRDKLPVRKSRSKFINTKLSRPLKPDKLAKVNAVKELYDQHTLTLPQIAENLGFTFNQVKTYVSLAKRMELGFKQNTHK